MKKYLLVLVAILFSCEIDRNKTGMALESDLHTTVGTFVDVAYTTAGHAGEGVIGDVEYNSITQEIRFKFSSVPTLPLTAPSWLTCTPNELDLAFIVDFKLENSTKRTAGVFINAECQALNVTEWIYINISDLNPSDDVENVRFFRQYLPGLNQTAIDQLIDDITWEEGEGEPDNKPQNTEGECGLTHEEAIMYLNMIGGVGAMELDDNHLDQACETIMVEDNCSRCVHIYSPGADCVCP